MEQVIKVLDVFYFPDKTIMITIDCQIEPMTGDYLTDEKENLIWKIIGVVLNVNKNVNLKPNNKIDNVV